MNSLDSKGVFYMRVTIRFFYSRHLLDGVSQPHSEYQANARGRYARRLMLIPRGIDDFERGMYRKCDYSRVEIDASSSKSAAGDPVTADACSTGDVILPCRLIERIRGTTAASRGDYFLVTACEVAANDATMFTRQFETAAAYMSVQPGFVRLRLFESLRDDDAFRFVNVAQWRTMHEFNRAFQARGFKALIKGGFAQSSQIVVAGITDYA
jgi:heme-degrading monooxygenase HmoA